MLRAMVSWGPTGGLSNGVSERNSRNRFRERLQAKGVSALTNIPEVNRRNIGIGELNRRIIDMKMEPGPAILPPPMCPAKFVQNITDIQTRLQSPQIVGNTYNRRDSSNSNASSFYCSMKSADMSRRSSQTSQLSTMRPSHTASSFYDPISPGSSRRSSQLSTITNGGQSLAPPPSSHLITTHLQRLESNECFTMPNSNKSATVGQPNVSDSDRRMSEPVNRSRDCMQISPTPRPRSTTPKSGGLVTAATTSELHPNQEVVLDEVEEDEMVENKLVIPDEMLQYLNEVADTDVKSNQNVTAKPDTQNSQCHLAWRNQSLGFPLSSPGIPSSPGSQIPISPMSNQMMPSPVASLPPATPMTNRPFTPSQLCVTNNNSALLWNEPKVQRTNQSMQQQQQQTQHLDQQTSNQSNSMNLMYAQHHQPSSNFAGHYNSRQMQNSQQTIYNSYMMPNCQQTMNYYQMQIQENSQHQANHPQMGPNMIGNRPNLIQCMRVLGHCHRNDQSACNCCKLTGNNVEIQCGDISQSQLSPAVHQRQQSQAANANGQQNFTSTMQTQQQSQQQQNNDNNCVHNDNCMHHSGMRQDTYQRTLEYVQNCQNWTENSETVSSSTHPSSNLIINDMTTSLNSLWEENRVFHMNSMYEGNRVF